MVNDNHYNIVELLMEALKAYAACALPNDEFHSCGKLKNEDEA